MSTGHKNIYPHELISNCNFLGEWIHYDDQCGHSFDKSIISAKITITELSHAWYHTELFIQCYINLWSYNFKCWKAFADTMYSFRSLYKSMQKESVYIGNLKRIVIGPQLLTLTEIRLRNIMWDSGTPFCMSSSIAWLAELPWRRD